MVQKHKSIGYMMITLLSLCLMFSLCVPMVFADDLNGVGSGNNVVNETVQTPVSTPETTVPQTNTSTTNTTNNDSISLGGLPSSNQSSKDVEDTANAIGGMFAQAGPDAKDIEAANAFIAPIASILNKVIKILSSKPLSSSPDKFS